MLRLISGEKPFHLPPPGFVRKQNESVFQMSCKRIDGDVRTTLAFPPGLIA